MLYYLFNSLNIERERERERHYLFPSEGGGRSVTLLEGFQASPARPSGKSIM